MVPSVKDLRLNVKFPIGPDSTGRQLAIVAAIFPATTSVLFDVDQLVGVWHRPTVHQSVGAVIDVNSQRSNSGSSSQAVVDQASGQSVQTSTTTVGMPCSVCLQQLVQATLGAFPLIYDQSQVRLFGGEQMMREFLQVRTRW